MAGRIPQSFIDELLDRVDLVELIDARVKLKKSGKNYMACCPFHDEKTPSFSVNAEKQFYHCFGCGESGNAIGFLMAYEHRDFPDVVETLAQQQGMEVPRESQGNREQYQQRQDLYSVLEKAGHFFQEQLRSHPQAHLAQEYLQARGLNSQTAHHFGIGYVPAGWDNLLRFFTSDNEGEQQQACDLLVKAGLLVEKESQGETSGEGQANNRYYDRFRQRIMFPIRDVRGRVIGFGGRVLSPDDKPKYLNSPETAVFHKGRELYGLYEAIKANRHLERIIVVEGYMDVVALAQFGISYATATLGTAASQMHLEKAFRHVAEVVFCFDGDEAGRRAAERALEASLPTLSEGRQVRFLFLPDGEDPDTYIRQHGTEGFDQLLGESMPLSEFLFELAEKNISLSTPEGRSQLVIKIMPWLRLIPQGVYRSQLSQLLAGKCQIDIGEINQLLAEAGSGIDNHSRLERDGDFAQTGAGAEKASGFHSGRKASSISSADQKSPRFSLWDEATSLLLRQPQLIEDCGLEELETLLNEKEPDAERFARCVALLQEKPEASLNKILGLWQSLYGAEDSQHLYTLAARESLLDLEAQARQFADTLMKLRRTGPELRLQALIDKARTQSLDSEEKQELGELLASGISPESAVSKPH